jgi:L-malate glycosyltransferase
LLAAADVYLMPSPMEAHSIALIEALASGVPVVASNIPAFAYASAFPGVALVGMDDGAALAKATRDFLVAGTRHERNLDAYDIAETERQYRDLISL